MARPPKSLDELGRLLVEEEAGDSPDPAALAAAVETACGKLRDDLIEMLGSGGIAALLKRALYLAQQEHPRLARVTVDTNSATCFKGLEEALAAGSRDEAAAAGATVLAHLIGLLVLLLGEGLGMQPVRKIWSHVVDNVRGVDE